MKRPPIDPAEIERRRQAILASDRERKSLLTPNERRSATQKHAKRRKLTARWDTASALQSWSILPKTVVLVDWHRDEHGCRARAVGCVEGNAPAG